MKKGVGDVNELISNVLLASSRQALARTATDGEVCGRVAPFRRLEAGGTLLIQLFAGLIAHYAPSVSKKSAKIAAMIENLQGKELGAHYLGYFECFNRGLFYEAHDVLEELWLPDRRGPDGDFFKGLIQFAGAFVHLQKHSDLRPRLRPAAALFKLARMNLVKYPGIHWQLEVRQVLLWIEEWLARLEEGNFTVNPLGQHAPPVVQPLKRPLPPPWPLG